MLRIEQKILTSSPPTTLTTTLQPYLEINKLLSLMINNKVNISNQEIKKITIILTEVSWTKKILRILSN